jgi:gliding motility-associated-like protein
LKPALKLNCTFPEVFHICGIRETRQESITFFVYGEDSNHCHSVDSVYIIVEENYSVFIPNSFSPNHDGVNDEFACYGICIEHFELTIYDRWGSEIYHSTDKSWNGTVNGTGHIVQEGVYVYKFMVEFCTREKQDFIGRVNKIN